MSKIYLSPSRVNTLRSCSWLYWCSYILKLPDGSNKGASIGHVCHLILELLGEKKHKKHYSLILKEKNVFCDKAITRIINRKIKKNPLLDEADKKDINELVLRGLMYDFFGNSLKLGKPTKVISEKDFELEIEFEGRAYRIKGFIDRLFLYKSKGVALIRDFKTNKKMYKGEEISDNLQDYMYTLAVRKLYPEYKNVKMEFVFLRIDDSNNGVLEMEEKTEQELKGLETELFFLQKHLDSFSEKTAKSNFAYDHGMPKDGSFSGRLKCGFATRPGELKKDGNPKWHCSYKFAFDYYVLLNKSGEQIKSAFTEDELVPLKKEDEKIEKKSYGGCPRIFQPREKREEPDAFDFDF
jgi:hypothetical protein